MRKLPVVFALAVAFTLLSPGPGAAQAPPTDSIQEPFVVSGFCPFDIALSWVGKGGFIALPGGGAIVTAPGLFVTIANAVNGNTVTLNSTGTFHQFTENGNNVTVVTGRNILWDPFAGFVLAIGTFRFAFDATGTVLVEPLNGTGQQIDICAMIE